MDTGEYAEYDGRNINGVRVSGYTIYMVEMEHYLRQKNKQESDVCTNIPRSSMVVALLVGDIFSHIGFRIFGETSS